VITYQKYVFTPIKVTFDNGKGNKIEIKSKKTPVTTPTIGPKIKPVILIGSPINANLKLGNALTGNILTEIMKKTTEIEIRTLTKAIRFEFHFLYPNVI